MADDITCVLCGGTDFYIDAGHYYCTECQTQTQDIREHTFAVPEETVAARQTSFRRIRAPKKTEDQFTSWESYNYIVLGLANELIELGANPKLKQIVRVLWFKYLSKLEVISGNPDGIPKLSGVNCKKDAEIIYGRTSKRRRASRTPSPSSNADSSNIDSASLRKEKTRRRRSMVLAEYDAISNTLNSEEVSVHNQSLTSLKSGGSDSSINNKYLQFNKYAKKELLRIMNKTHLKTHCRDVNNSLNCHKLSYQSFPFNYIQGPLILSRNKIYSILYLGLLINKDNIQLGDLLRFIREGKLSYHDVLHLFPEELRDKPLNIKSWNTGHTLLSHYRMRMTTARLATQLKVTKYVKRQNLVLLCERYGTELNLPDEFVAFTVNLMSHVSPHMKLSEKSKVIPNYEGRIMSMLMFTMKLYYGLDGVTENNFSSLAEKINNTKMHHSTMFIWRDWAHYISYRKLMLTQHHFPTQYFCDNENVHNPNLFTAFMTEQNLKNEKDFIGNITTQILKQQLEKLQNKQNSHNVELQFTPSLTPYRDYTRILLELGIAKKQNYLVDVLETNFKQTSLNFLHNPILYLKELQEDIKIGIKHCGANNLELVKIPNLRVEREVSRNAAKRDIFIKLTSKDKHTIERCKSSVTKATVRNTRRIIKDFQQQHMNTFLNNIKNLRKTYRRAQGNAYNEELINVGNVNTTSNISNSENYIHHNPYERYCLRSIDASSLSKNEFYEFIISFPESFQVLLNECARVTEQHPKYLFEEFNDVEIYLCYIAKFNAKDKSKGSVVHKDLERFINKARKIW